MGRRRPRCMTFGLCLLAPLVGEFLLGNDPISHLYDLLVFVPLYGAGAVVVRESGRRLGGWPAIALFAAAYALVEEALVDQMVFDPGYLGLSSFHGYAEIPGLRISGTLVLWSLALHTVWSICVPIAIVEAFDPSPQRPWLRRPGYAGTWVLFVAACVSLGVAQATDMGFVGTPAQFGVSVLAIVALVAAGVRAGRRPAPPPLPGRPPRPAWLGVAALALTSGYWLSTSLPLDGVLAVVAEVALWLAAAVTAWTAVRRWSRHAGWNGRHRLALAAGAAGTYALWFGPTQAVEAGTGPVEIVAGALVFGLVVLAIVRAGVASLRARPYA